MVEKNPSIKLEERAWQVIKDMADSEGISSEDCVARSLREEVVAEGILTKMMRHMGRGG